VDEADVDDRPAMDPDEPAVEPLLQFASVKSMTYSCPPEPANVSFPSKRTEERARPVPDERLGNVGGRQRNVARLPTDDYRLMTDDCD
jgi:hypothetical protein